MSGLSHATRMVRARNYRLAFALQYRVHTSLDNPGADRVIQAVLDNEPPYEGREPVYVAVARTDQRILERMREFPTR